MTSKNCSFNAALSRLIFLLLVSPVMLWHLPGNECHAENEPAECSVEVEFDEVTLCGANSSPQQTRRARSCVQLMHAVLKGHRSDPFVLPILQPLAGQVSLQGRSCLLTC